MLRGLLDIWFLFLCFWRMKKMKSKVQSWRFYLLAFKNPVECGIWWINLVKQTEIKWVCRQTDILLIFFHETFLNSFRGCLLYSQDKIKLKPTFSVPHWIKINFSKNSKFIPFHKRNQNIIWSFFNKKIHTRVYFRC